MHIMVVNVFFAPHSYGGATVVAEGVAQSLAQRHGVQVTAISAIARDDLPAYAVVRAEARGILSLMINLPPNRGYVQHYSNSEVAERVDGIARDLEPDLVHLHCLQELGADMIPRLKARGLPVVLSTHDYWWLCERQFMMRPDGRWCGQDPVRVSSCRGCAEDLSRAELRTGALASMAHAADLITAPSAYSAGLHLRSGFGEGRMRVWQNGVRPPRPGFFEAQAARRAADPRPVFGFVGGPSAMKGWPEIRGAFTGLSDAGFRGELVDASLDGNWWTGIDPSPMAGEWSVVPRYDPACADDFYAGIDVLLFPSQWPETFGLTVREALARGIRVIQTGAGGAAEHGAPDAVRMLPPGAGPKALRAAVQAELARDARGTDPVPQHSIDDQADAFLSLVRPLVPRDVLALRNVA